MKKIKLLKIITIFTILTSLGFLINSCVKSSSTKCTTCERTSNLELIAKFDNTIGNFSSNAKVWFDNKNIYTEFDNVILENQKFDLVSIQIESQIAIVNNAENITLAYSFYKKGNLVTDSLISIKDIEGISKYYLNTKSNKLYHQLFLKNDQTEKFIEVSQLNSEINGIVSNYMHTISSKVVAIEGKSAIIFVVNSSKIELEERAKNSINMLEKKLKNYLNTTSNRENFNSDPTLVEPSGEVCKAPCAESVKRECTYKTLGWSCKGTCDVATAKEIISTSDLWSANDSISITYNTALAYSFRDQVLTKSAFGQKYIDYYYELGDEFYNKIDLETALYTGRVLVKVNFIMNELMNNNNSQNILIENSVRNEIIGLLNFYLSKTNNSDAVNKINEIISDINNLQGKTKTQVKTILNI